jgi:hypothetical protein
MTLRYHLQAQHSNPGNDFMDFTQRPPDVFWKCNATLGIDTLFIYTSCHKM